MDYPIYEKYMLADESRYYLDLFREHGIKAILEQPKDYFDPILGSNQADLFYLLRMPAENFKEADQCIEKKIKTEGLPEDYHLLSFEDKNLFAILEDVQHWSRVEVIIASLILKQRGYDLCQQVLQEHVEMQYRISSPKNWKQTFLLIFVYAITIGFFFHYSPFSLLVAGFCLLWGLVNATFKDADFYGRRYFIFSNFERKHGFVVALLNSLKLIVFIYKAVV